MDVALKILVIEHDETLLAATLSLFKRQGHEARGVTLADDLDEVVGGFTPDVYVIDPDQPDADGLALTRRLRISHPDVGIVVATARTAIGDKLKAYESGADVYLTKPVNPQELMASVAAMARRARRATLNHSRTMECHAVSMQLVGPLGTVCLSASDTQILCALIRAPGQHLERWKLASVLGAGKDDGLAAATLEMRMTRLRRKLTAAGAPSPCIKAVRNAGYTLCCAVAVR